MTRVKICGITNLTDAQMGVKAGAWALGFIFYKKSPRYVSPSKVRKIIEHLPPFITPVGVFVNHKEGAVRDICQVTRIHTVQFHGEEDPGFCKRFKDYKIIKAFRVGQDFDMSQLLKYKVDAYLLDTAQGGEYGGTGVPFNWDLIKGKTLNKPLILSGGLNAQNVPEALASIKPFAVDVCSGVEQKSGMKDYQKVMDFIGAIYRGQ